MELEDLEQVARRMVETAGFRAHPDGHVGVELAGGVDLGERRLGMKVVARIADWPDVSGEHWLEQPRNAGTIVCRLDDDRDRLVHRAGRDEDAGLTMRRRDGGIFIRQRSALAAV